MEIIQNIEKEVEKIEGVVVTEVKDVLDVLSAEEKLALRDIELANIRAHISIKSATEIVENTEKNYQQKLTEFSKKYSTPLTHAFDIATQTFKRIEAKL